VAAVARDAGVLLPGRPGPTIREALNEMREVRGRMEAAMAKYRGRSR
jgi:hypothetical protein